MDYAYGQLLDEGYIEAKPCKGYFVCPIEELMGLEDVKIPHSASGIESARGALSHREETTGGKRGEGEPDGADFHAPVQGSYSPVRICDFSPHDIDMSGFPFGVWKKITKNILTDANSDLFSRGEPQGDYELRQTISRYLHSSRG